MQISFLSNLTLPWLLIIGSSLASVLGATVVFVDSLVRRWTSYHDFTLSDNRRFITSVLSLSSGILFYSSQFILIPEALESIQETPYFSKQPYFYLIIFYGTGMGLMYVLNKVIAIIAPSAIACPCSHEESDDNEISSIVIGDNESDHHNHNHQHDHINCTSNSHSNNNLSFPSISTEHSHLLSKSSNNLNYNSTHSSGLGGSLGRYSKDSSKNCDCNFMPLDQKSSSDLWSRIPIRDLDEFSHYSCHSSTSKLPTIPTPQSSKVIAPREVEDRNQLWTISIQTAIAIALHKLPEGLITVMSSESNESLGLNLFIGIACHNFPEGFMLSIPFYAATDSSLKAFMFASLIGGLTQPIGGFLGLLLLNRITPSQIVYFNGVLFSLVSGLMLLVILQSFLPTIRRQLGHSSALPAIISFIMGALGMAILSHFFVHD